MLIFNGDDFTGDKFGGSFGNDTSQASSRNWTNFLEKHRSPCNFA